MTFTNCSTYNLYGGNGNGMFLNPTPTFQSNSSLWPAPSTGWSSGSRTWNLRNPADNTQIDFVVVGSANNGQVLIGPSSNLMFDSTKSPIFWWRMAAVTAPVVTPALAPSTQSIAATYGEVISATSAFTPTGLTAPITYSTTAALPSGISINSSTGVISGTIQEGTASLTSYTVRAIDANLQVATGTVAFSASLPTPTPTPTPTQTPTPTTAPASNTGLPVTLASTGANLDWLIFAGSIAAIAGSGFLAFSRRKRIW